MRRRVTVRQTAALSGDRQKRPLTVLVEQPTAAVDARRRIMNSAQKIILEVGVDQLTIDNVARDAKVSKTTLYRHFEDALSLYREVVIDLALQTGEILPSYEKDDRPTHEVLFDAACELYDHSSLPISIAPFRAQISFESSLSGLGLELREKRSSINLGNLAAYLQKLGSGSISDGLLWATRFASLSTEAMRLLLVSPKRNAAHRRQYAHQTVKLFLFGCLNLPSTHKVNTRWSEISLSDTMPRLNPYEAEDRSDNLRLRGSRLSDLLRAARVEFFARGFRKSRVDVICADAAVAKTTLYRHFGDKAGLFAAAMRDGVNTLVDGAKPLRVASDDPRVVLQTVGRYALDYFVQAEHLALIRTVIAEGDQFPELGEDIYSHMLEIVRRPLSAYFKGLKDEGVFKHDDFELASEQFLLLLEGGSRFFIFGPPEPSVAEDIVRDVVRLFFEGYPACVSTAAR